MLYFIMTQLSPSSTCVSLSMTATQHQQLITLTVARRRLPSCLSSTTTLLSHLEMSTSPSASIESVAPPDPSSAALHHPEAYPRTLFLPCAAACKTAITRLQSSDADAHRPTHPPPHTRAPTLRLTARALSALPPIPYPYPYPNLNLPASQIPKATPTSNHLQEDGPRGPCARFKLGLPQVVGL